MRASAEWRELRVDHGPNASLFVLCAADLGTYMSFDTCRDCGQRISDCLRPASCRKSKKESCALVHFSLGPDLSAMLLDNALHGGKPTPVPSNSSARWRRSNTPNNLLAVSLVKAGAIVPNEEDRHSLLLDPAHFDDGGFTRPGYI